MTLDAQDIAAIAQAVVRAGPVPTGLILTTAEAIKYVKKDSKSGFYAWAKAYGVERSGSDRYPTHRLDRGLERESRAKFSTKSAATAAPIN